MHGILNLHLTEPLRADLAILDALKKQNLPISRRQLKNYFDGGKVRIGGRRVSAAWILESGDHLAEIEGLNTATPEAQAASSCFLDVLYEDSRWLILNKKSGIPSAPQHSQEAMTAVGAALARFPEFKSVDTGSLLEPGLLHRLDTGTSGALAFAKTTSEHARLRGLWSSGKIKKIYRAIVGISPDAEPLPRRIETPLGHDPKSAKKMVPVISSRTLTRGQPLSALTEILESKSIRDSKSLDLTVRIQTGVMHQIRCHLSSQGYPILGDSLYKGADAPRLFLHAWKLVLPRPSGEGLEIEAPLPENWP